MADESDLSRLAWLNRSSRLAPINWPRVNDRVWTFERLQRIGSFGGPQVDVPADTGGRVVRTERHPTIGIDLYVVYWDTGETTTDRFQDIFCIGPFADFMAFKEALLTAQEVKVDLGPKGGFHGAEFSISSAKGELTLSYVKDQLWQWRIVRPILEQAGARLEEKRRTVRKQANRLLL